MRAPGPLGALGAGLLTVAAILGVAGLAVGHHGARTRLVAEDASAPLRAVAIHYAPSADAVALGVWRQLLAALPPSVEVDVEVAQASDFTRLTSRLDATAHPERLHPVVVGAPITTWSRDRYAALVDDDGGGAVLAPPRIETKFRTRAGDFASPFALARWRYHAEPRVADLAFEGGDLAATPRYVFVDANLAARNVGRGATDRPTLERRLHGYVAQELIWLGDAVDEIPHHHIMMYMVPLDDHTIAVGDLAAGRALLARDPAGAAFALDPDEDAYARRFDHAAELLAARGFAVVRVPALVLPGGGSYVTYTNALFDRRADGTRVVYLPTYALPTLDAAGRAFYEARGYEVHPIDVSAIYHLNGSLGCLVNVLARG